MRRYRQSHEERMAAREEHLLSQEYRQFIDRELDPEDAGRMSSSPADSPQNHAIILRTAIGTDNEDWRGDRRLDDDDYEQLGQIAAEEGLGEHHVARIAMEARGAYMDRRRAIDAGELPRDAHRAAEGLPGGPGTDYLRSHAATDPIGYEAIAERLRSYTPPREQAEDDPGPLGGLL